jgi:glycosyltransferase involved in cell wall biosynthesis
MLIKNNIDVIDIKGKSYISKVKSLTEILIRENPDIVHTNVGSSLHVLIPLALARSKATHIFTAHSMGYRIFHGFKKKIIQYKFKKRQIIPVAICDTVKRSIIESYHISNDEVELVYNGVDTKEFIPSHNKSKKFTVVTTGRLCDVKNQSLLIDSFNVFHKKHTDTHLRIIGSGELYKKLRRQVIQYDLEQSVTFEGNKSNIAHYLQSSDVYCCTSLVEGLPISVLEAMSCGLPIVTTPAGGVVDIVKNKLNGFITKWDANDIAEFLETIYFDKILKKKLSIASRNIAEGLDIKKCAEQYELIYEKYSK